jgi:hypothetical protein
MPAPKTIQHWPGRTGIAQNKVPTTLYYTGPNQTLWGFLCEGREYDAHRKEWFKTYLDPAKLHNFRQKSPNEAYDMSDIREWYTLYLRNLYEHIRATVIRTHSHWERLAIDFVFSVPSTWASLSIPRDFEELIKQAGFADGGQNRSHTVEIGLTEPQAAAVYTMRDSSRQFYVGEVILVCDAGGGTTDIAILQITRIDNNGLPHLSELLGVQGANIGATVIDEAFYELAKSRLEAAHYSDPDNKAYSMMHDVTFQNLKCSFGLPESRVPNYRIQVPGLTENDNNPIAKIEAGKMIFTQ